MSLKPLSTSVNAAMLHRMILHWKQAEVSPLQINKMLQLYLGEIHWMDNTGKYPAVNFYEMRKSLKFKTTELFLKCIIKCMGFGIIYNSKEHNYKNIAAFYSPLWHSTNDGTYIEVTEGNLNFSSKKRQKALSLGGSHTKNIYNINNNLSMTPSEEAQQGKDSCNQGDLPENCNLDAIKEFIEKLPSDAAACQIIIKPINEYTEQKFPTLKACCYEASNDTNLGGNDTKLDSNDSPKPSTILPNPATLRFLSHYLLTYLNARAKTYATRDHDGRIYWISNLIKYDFMHKMMDRAVSDFIKQHGGSERAMQQQNRPLSPYEYQDPLTHQRLYDFTNQDGKPCQARIPANAAPRPSDTVYWNKFSKTWMEWKN